MMPDAVEDRYAYLGACLRLARRTAAAGLQLGVAIGLRDHMVAAGLVGSDPVHKERRAGGQCADLAVSGERLRYAAEKIKTDLAGWLVVARNSPARKQRLDLRGEPECPAVI